MSPTQAQSQVHAHAQPHPPLPQTASSQIQQAQAYLQDSGPPLQSLYASQTNTQRCIPKSRTVGMLSNIRSSFRRSRSSLTIDALSRKSSLSSCVTTSTLDQAQLDSTSYSQTYPGHFVWGFHAASYWAGRFSATRDRLRCELFNMSCNSEVDHNDEDHFEGNDKVAVSKLKTSLTEANLRCEATTPEQMIRNRLFTDNDILRCKQVFAHLVTCCKDDAARKSLYTFQLQYARNNTQQDLLPEGAKMEPLLERLGRRVEGAFGRRMSSRLN